MRFAGWLVAIVIVLSAFGLASCSIPNLEGQQCTDARESVREFYFWYLGTDATMRDKQRDFYDRFVAPDFRPAGGANLDPFFLSDTTPTTLKIGKCELKNDTHVEMQVQLYWKHEGKTDQKEVYADVAKAGDQWLIEKVESR